MGEKQKYSIIYSLESALEYMTKKGHYVKCELKQ